MQYIHLSSKWLCSLRMSIVYDNLHSRHLSHLKSLLEGARHYKDTEHFTLHTVRVIKKHDLFMQYHLSPKHILTSCGTHIASNHASTTAVIYFANKLTLTRLNIIISKIFSILHHLYCCYVYTLYNQIAHCSCTSLLILLFIKSTVYCIAHVIV